MRANDSNDARLVCLGHVFVEQDLCDEEELQEKSQDPVDCSDDKDAAERGEKVLVALVREEVNERCKRGERVGGHDEDLASSETGRHGC